jgi:hypothetical protein
VAKPDSTRAAIVAALRAAGASVVDHEGRKGEPDLVVGYRGRMWFAELKTPGKESGVCGCDNTDVLKCRKCFDYGACTGHIGLGNAERKTWHAQLAFAEAWQGPRVLVWTTVEQALREIGVGPAVIDGRGPECSAACMVIGGCSHHLNYEALRDEA